MDRFNHYFRQKVTEEELDADFAAVESAISDWAGAFEFIGIASGASVAQKSTPSMHVDAEGPAVIYDKSAQHIAWSSTQDVDCNVDEDGQPTGVSGVGNSKWLSIFAHFERDLTDPRTDGFGDTVYYSEAESFSLRVVQGAESAMPSRPGLHAEDILLADILLAYGQTTITTSDIYDDRTEYVYILTGSPTSISERSLHDVLQAMLDAVNTGVADLADDTAPDDGATLLGIDAITGTLYSSPQGTLKAMLVDLLGALDSQSGTSGGQRIGIKTYAGGGTGGFDIGGATDTQTAIEVLIQRLNDQTAGSDGGERIGSDAKSSGGLGRFDLAQSSVGEQIEAIVQALSEQSGSYPGDSRIGADAIAGTYLSVSQGSVFSHFTDLLGYLNLDSGTDGASRIGAKASGGLAAGSVRAQLDALLRAKYTNALYDATFRGPLLQASDASDDKYYTLFKSGDGPQTFAMVAGIRDGDFFLCMNIQVKTAGNGFEIVDTSHEAIMFHFRTVMASVTLSPLQILRFATGHAADLGSGIPSSEDTKTELQIPASANGDGTFWNLAPNGPSTDAEQTCHWSIGATAAGASEGLDASVAFRSYYSTAPTSFTISTSGSANCTVGTPSVTYVTKYGCGITGPVSAGAGQWYAYGTVDVSP
jgi:hypothetical protein